MKPPALSKCACTHCGGRIEFETESAGQEVPCPHCGNMTTLYVETMVPTPTVFRAVADTEFRRMLIKVALCAFGMVLVVLLGFFIYKHRQAALSFFDTVFGVVFAIVGLGIALAIYFCPAIVASSRKRRNAEAIFYLNLFLGWTLLGWVGALIWATAFERPLEPVEKMGRKSTRAEGSAALPVH